MARRSPRRCNLRIVQISTWEQYVLYCVLRLANKIAIERWRRKPHTTLRWSWRGAPRAAAIYELFSFLHERFSFMTIWCFMFSSVVQRQDCPSWFEWKWTVNCQREISVGTIFFISHSAEKKRFVKRYYIEKSSKALIMCSRCLGLRKQNRKQEDAHITKRSIPHQTELSWKCFV